MNDVRSKAVQRLGKASVDAGVPVAIPVPRVVDDVKRDPSVVGVLFHAHPEVRRKRILLAREDMDFVAVGEPMREGLSIDLGPAL